MSRELCDVQSTVARVAHFIDLKKWTELRALYANEVEVDYTSLFGGEPQKVAGDALVEGWHSRLARVVTQHLLGPVDVEITGGRATAACHVRALHFAKGAKSGESWEVLGHYTFVLSHAERGWHIIEMKLTALYQAGNPNLLSEI